MNNTMTERFNVSGALLVKLFGTPHLEQQGFEDQAGARARPRCHVEPVQRVLLFVDVPAHLARDRVGLRLGWSALRRRRPRHRHGRRPHRVPATSVRAAQPAVERADRRDDRARVVRPRVRGPRPRADDRRQAGCDRRTPRPRPDRVRPRRLPLPARRRGVAGVARVGRRPRPDAEPPGALGRVVHRRTGRAGRARRSFRGGQDDDQQPRAPPLRRASGSDPHQRPRRARRNARVDARDDRRGHPGRPPLPRHHPRQPRVRAAGGNGSRDARGRSTRRRSFP